MEKAPYPFCHAKRSVPASLGLDPLGRIGLHGRQQVGDRHRSRDRTSDVDVIGRAADLVCGTIAGPARRGEVAVEFLLDFRQNRRDRFLVLKMRCTRTLARDCGIGMLRQGGCDWALVCRSGTRAPNVPREAYAPLRALAVRFVPFPRAAPWAIAARLRGCKPAASDRPTTICTTYCPPGPTRQNGDRRVLATPGHVDRRNSSGPWIFDKASATSPTWAEPSASVISPRGIEYRMMSSVR